MNNGAVCCALQAQRTLVTIKAEMYYSAEISIIPKNWRWNISKARLLFLFNFIFGLFSSFGASTWTVDIFTSFHVPWESVHPRVILHQKGPLECHFFTIVEQDGDIDNPAKWYGPSLACGVVLCICQIPFFFSPPVSMFHVEQYFSEITWWVCFLFFFQQVCAKTRHLSDITKGSDTSSSLAKPSLWPFPKHGKKY